MNNNVSNKSLKVPKKIMARQHEITEAYLHALDVHLADIVAGRATEMFEIRDLANVLHIHPTHLSNTIKLTTGVHPVSFTKKRSWPLPKRCWLKMTSRSMTLPRC